MMTMEDTAATTETTVESDGGASVSLTANPDGELAYEESTLSAPAGTVTIEFDNPASIGHDVVVEDQNANEITRTDVITGNGHRRGRVQGGRLHVLLLGRRPPRRRHGGHADGRVGPADGRT